MTTFDPAAREHLRHIFGELNGAAALLRAVPREGRMSAAALYAARDDMPDLAQPARRVHSRMVADSARATLPFARAASSLAQSAGATARRGDDCQIRIEQSRAEPDQYFVLVELAKGLAADAPTSLVVCDSDDRCRRFPLPAARDGVAQLIAEKESDLMRLISDPASKVYLR